MCAVGLVAAVWLAAGCASTPYSFAEHGETELTLQLREGEGQFERGRPNAWIDGFGHYFFSLPSKLLLLNWKVDNHDISNEVEQSVREYLWANGLCNTKVRLNQYAPGGEYRRLFKNREMPGFWRFTLGIISVTFYTIFPERLFAGFPIIGGGDHYNPYTNTISLYSNSRPIALHEGGHAKDFASVENRHWKGFYSGARAIPLVGLFVALWQEALASNDALSWDLATADSRASKSAYRTLYPAYGTYVGGTAQTGASFFLGGWILYAIQYGVVVTGHIAGQTRALFVRDRPEGFEMSALAGPTAIDLEAAAGCGEAARDGPEPLGPKEPDAPDSGGGPEDLEEPAEPEEAPPPFSRSLGARAIPLPTPAQLSIGKGHTRTSILFRSALDPSDPR